MADIVTLPTGEKILVDELTTYNGGPAPAGALVQRGKMGFGVDGDFKDVTPADPLPVTDAAVGAQADAQAGNDTGTWSLISLVKRLLGKLPTLGQKTMAASQPVVIASDQSAIPVTGSFSATADLGVALLHAMELFNEGPHIDPASGRLRVVLDALGGAQTLGTVTTCATLTSMSQVAGVPANSFIYDSIDSAWAQCIRGRIT